MTAAITAKEQQYARFCEKAGLKQNLNRLYVKGYKRDFEYIKPTTTVYNKNTVVDNNRITKRFDKDTIKKLDRKQLEHYATDIFARNQKGLSSTEAFSPSIDLVCSSKSALTLSYCSALSFTGSSSAWCALSIFVITSSSVIPNCFSESLVNAIAIVSFLFYVLRVLTLGLPFLSCFTSDGQTTIKKHRFIAMLINVFSFCVMFYTILILSTSSTGTTIYAPSINNSSSSFPDSVS